MEPSVVSLNLHLDPPFFPFQFYNLFLNSAEKTVNLQENVNPDLIMSMTQGVPSQLTGIQGRKEQVQDAIPKIAPKWLKYDR
jgi:hypothetical protein